MNERSIFCTTGPQTAVLQYKPSQALVDLKIINRRQLSDRLTMDRLARCSGEPVMRFKKPPHTKKAALAAFFHIKPAHPMAFIFLNR